MDHHQDADQVSDDIETFKRVLESIADKRGVYGGGLLEILTAKVRLVWAIPSSEVEVVELRKYVTANLRKHILELEPRTPSRRDAYVRSVSVSFNVYDGVDLRNTNPTQRREWIEKQPKDSGYRAVEKTGREWLDHAIEQIAISMAIRQYVAVKLLEFKNYGVDPPVDAGLEELLPFKEDADPLCVVENDLLSGNYQPPGAVKHVVQSDSANGVPSNSDLTKENPRPELDETGHLAAQAPQLPEPMEPSPPAEELENVRPPRGRAFRLSLLMLAAAVVASGVVVGIKFFTSGSPSGSPSQPVSVSMASGPVHVDSVAYERDGSGKSVGWSYVLPQRTQLSATDLASLNNLGGSGQAYQSWMESKGAIVPDDASIQLALRNKTNQLITIENIEVVKQCRQPLSGTLFYAPQQGAQGDIYLTFDLDNRFPVAKDGETGASYFGGSAAHTVQLSPGEVSTLLIDATTEQQYCTFHFNLIVDPGDGGSPVSETVDDNGKPFAVTAVPTADQEPKFTYYQQVYAADAAPDGSGFAAVNPVTYGGG